MKKKLVIAFIISAMLILSACGTQPADTPSGEIGDTMATDNPNDIDDNMTSEDGNYDVAFVTDVGALKDKSFNEGTWNGVKLYAANNGLSYKYYQPANDAQATDDDRYNAMKAAVDGGAKVVVCAGFLQGTAIAKAAEEFADTHFVFIDGWPVAGSDGEILTNVAAIAFSEEQCGYFAGYSVVMEGFEKLGFCGGGGGENPAVNRYGFGYLQGANDAAKELGKTVEVNYSFQYGASYSASPELQTMANGWYTNGTEIIFACGGTMFDSIVAAAAASDGSVIGVDVDQSTQSDTVVTSAMKGLSQATEYAIAKSFDGEWDSVGGVATSLGVQDGAVGLPTESWSMTNYTVEQYNELLEKVKSGELVVDPEYPADPATLTFENLEVSVI